MDSDKRRHRRLPLEVEVELHRAGQPMRVVQTEDLSIGGVLLLLDDADRPPLGTLVQVRVVGTLGEGETPPMVDARVVRHAPAGVAIQFSDDTFLSSADSPVRCEV